MCVPDVFVKAGVPTGAISEIAMVLTAVSSRDTGYLGGKSLLLHYHESIE